MPITVNEEQRLYVIHESSGGYTCLGFDFAERRRVAVLTWMGVAVPPVEVGTVPAYDAYDDAVSAGGEHSIRTGGLRCLCDLVPELDIHLGKRVEVRSVDGDVRVFRVGRSTGWMPDTLEVIDGDDFGDPAYIAKGDTIILLPD